ncbi:MAG: DUF4912 domain-containing protein [Treponema sp.]|nr:DUF4912 domain-containing protein [Treponema sp.]
MDENVLTRSYLETLSSTDLISLANDFDIDVPVDLNRRFIIGELLEVANDSHKDDDVDMIISTEESDFGDTEARLPDSYNDTMINAVLRNPAWAFVYWDISEADSHYAEMLLCVLFFDTENDEQSSDSFTVKINPNDHEQYVLLPAGKTCFSIDLRGKNHDKMSVLASSPRICIPHGCEYLNTLQPGKNIEMSEILSLSGMRSLLRHHYDLHRQSFS